MWLNDEDAGRTIEDCVRAADALPQLPVAFRSRVLDEALRVRHRSLSLHRVQALTTSFLAASLLLFLPGYYHTLNNPISWPSTSTLAPSWTMATRPDVSHVSADAYEWSLVQAALADRSESARIIRGAL
jgi:hypothetical protein